MNINIDTFMELYNTGLKPIPIVWDVDNKIATKYPKHELPEESFNESWVRHELGNGMNQANGIALKLFPPFGMFDFDIKNTNNKQVYNDWFRAVESTRPDILNKVVIETTKSEGFHVYIKYEKLSHKIAIARCEGREVISVYTGGLLSFCYPSPGYNIIHNDFNDLDFLTEEEFEYLVSTAAFFNEDKEHTPGKHTVALIEYPTEYENICIQFDNNCTDEVFEAILNAIDLFIVKDQKGQFKNKNWLPYLRAGSTAAYSAKAYFYSKRLLIFSASFTGFPTWHDSAKCGDNTWSLTPSKIIYYKNKKNWTETIEEIKLICESACIDLIEQQPVTKQELQHEDRLKFPYDIFPETVVNYISHQTIQSEYLAAFTFGAAASCIGGNVTLRVIDGYYVKPIIYLAVVAPPGSAKSPAMKKSFKPLEDHDQRLYLHHKENLEKYNDDLNEYKRDKKNNDEPVRPVMNQILIKDSTIEMVIKILSHNPYGCCILADELSGFFKRMNQYKDGDEVQKWLEMWSGATILLQRISRDENKVQDPHCSIVGGIQPGVLQFLSSKDNEHNGFLHRWLFSNPTPEPKGSLVDVKVPGIVKEMYDDFFRRLLAIRNNDKLFYGITEDAFKMYQEWYDYKNIKYNRATDDHVKGIISKYQEYCLRFALIIQLMNEPQMEFYVNYNSMERAIRLTEYFLGHMHKTLKILMPETPADQLKPPYDKFYNELSAVFTTKTAVELGKNHGLKDSRVKMFLRGQLNKTLREIDRGSYEKLF